MAAACWLAIKPICLYNSTKEVAAYSARKPRLQRFDIAATGNLVLVDWVSSGRYAVGERFQFTHYQSRQSIYYDDQLVIEDAVRLVPACDRQ